MHRMAHGIARMTTKIAALANTTKHTHTQTYTCIRTNTHKHEWMKETDSHKDIIVIQQIKYKIILSLSVCACVFVWLCSWYDDNNKKKLFALYSWWSSIVVRHENNKRTRHTSKKKYSNRRSEREKVINRMREKNINDTREPPSLFTIHTYNI